MIRAYVAFYFVIAIILLSPVLVIAQSPAPVEFPWGDLGVNMTIIGVIIGFVQVIKTTVLKNLPGITYIGVTVVLSGIAAYFTQPEGSAVVDYMRAVLSWSAAAAFTFDTVSRLGLQSLFRAKSGK